MKVDKGQFDTLLGRMLAKEPQKTSDIHKKKAKSKSSKPSRKSAKRKSKA
jgi:hypothetical protein